MLAAARLDAQEPARAAGRPDPRKQRGDLPAGQLADTPGIVDNVHWNRVAALAVSLLEMMQFGKSYAQAIIKNSQALGKGLADRGIAVKGAAQGYSKSHQVLLDCDKIEGRALRQEARGGQHHHRQRGKGGDGRSHPDGDGSCRDGPDS